MFHIIVYSDGRAIAVEKVKSGTILINGVPWIKRVQIRPGVCAFTGRQLPIGSEAYCPMDSKSPDWYMRVFHEQIDAVLG